MCWGECDRELRTFKVEMGEITVGPGEEHIFCVYKKIGNEEAVKIGRIDTDISQAAHHVVMLLTYGVPEKTEPGRCAEFEHSLNPNRETPLTVTQRPHEELQLPPGVGLTLLAGQMVKIEMHFQNASDSPVVVNASGTFYEIDPTEYQYELGLLAVQTPDVFIPALSDVTIGPENLVLPPDLEGVTFISMQGHTHERGKQVTAEVFGEGGADQKRIYRPEPYSWSEPEVVRSDSLFTVPRGGTLAFTCDYSNSENRDIEFGCQAANEMCMVWGHYYPKSELGNRLCMRSEYDGGFQGCCPGDQWFCDFLHEEAIGGF